VPVLEAPFREKKFGLVAAVDGWFVLNACDNRWRDYGPLGASCNFEGKRPFRQSGFNLNVLEPGQSLGSTTASDTRRGSSSSRASAR
jgi:hypothetical protein